MNENESIGFLTVIVRSANGALPIENAQVTVYGESELDENGVPSLFPSDVVYSLKTDKSGMTPKVALSTKNKELSLSPENNEPFSTYSVLVSKDGYYDNAYYNLPIFQGVNALQPVLLIPLSEFAKADDYIPNEGRRYEEFNNQ